MRSTQYRAPGRTTIIRKRKQGRWASSVEEKLNWLRVHYHGQSKEKLVHEMKRAKLLASTMYWRDFRLSRYLELL